MVAAVGAGCPRLYPRRGGALFAPAGNREASLSARKVPILWPGKHTLSCPDASAASTGGSAMSGSGQASKPRGTDNAPVTPVAVPPTPTATLEPAARAALDRLIGMESLLRTAAGLTVAAVIVLALYYGRELLVPIALAAFLGFLLDPLVTRLKRWGLPRAVAAIVVTLAAVAAIAGVAAFMLSQMRALSADLPTYQDTIRSKLVELRQELKAPSDWDGALSTLRVVSKEIDQVDGVDRTPQPVVIADPETGPARAAALWMARVGSPAVTAGIVLLFVVLILIDRDGLRDRILRVMGGGNLHVATDALGEAGTRIGRYLRMQLIVNAIYGVPLAIGLFLIGVPGAFLWGAFAIVLRFVPYLGPVLCALFPLLLAFAVDPGWSMVMWTIGLIATLEVVSNNIIEPWLYGASTGLSPLSIIIAAMFWTTLWGPVGLILSTPLTVCLLVLGRHLPGLALLETLLGSEPVLDAPNRLYQRLLAGNVVDATELATEVIDRHADQLDGPDATTDAVVQFYDSVAIPTLRLASANHTAAATVQHRLQFTTGMAELLQEIQDDYPVAEAEESATSPRRIHCIGARWEVDALAAQMVGHALALHGLDVRVTALTAGRIAASVLDRAQAGDVVCLCAFHPAPQALLRQITRRIRRSQKAIRIIAMPLALVGQLDDPPHLGLAADDWAGTVRELARRLTAEGQSAAADEPPQAPPDGPSQTPRATADIDIEGLRERHRDLVRQVADVFDVAHAQVSWAEAGGLAVSGSTLPVADDGAIGRLPEAETACRLVLASGAPVVIEDVQRDPRVATLPVFLRHRIRFYAGVPLRRADVGVIGSLCIMDTRPGSLDDTELALLTSMADKLVDGINARKASQ